MSTEFLLDNFTDANGTSLSAHTPDEGQGWVQHPTLSPSAPGAIQDNRAYGGDAASYWYNEAEPHSANYSVQAELHFIDGTATAVGVLGRLKTDESSYYSLERDSTTIYLKRSFEGVVSTLGSVSRTIESCFLELRLDGDEISAYVIEEATLDHVDTDGSTNANRVPCIQVTDDVVTDKGRVGLQLADSTSTTGTHVDWVQGWSMLANPLLIDSFTAADDTDLDDHVGEQGVWIRHPESGTWWSSGDETGLGTQKIVNGEVYSNVDNAVWYSDQAPTNPDYVVKTILHRQDGNARNTRTGVIARLNPLDHKGYVLYHAGTRVWLVRTDGVVPDGLSPSGEEVSRTSLGPGSNPELDFLDFSVDDADAELTLEVQGDTISSYLRDLQTGLWYEWTSSNNYTKYVKRTPWVSVTDDTYKCPGLIGLQVSMHPDPFGDIKNPPTYFEATNNTSLEPYVCQELELDQLMGENSYWFSQEFTLSHQVFTILAPDDRRVPQSYLQLQQEAFSPSHPTTLHELGLTQTLEKTLLTSFEFDHELNLSQQVTAFRGTPWLPIPVSHLLLFDHRASTIVPGDPSTELNLSDEAEGSLGLKDDLGLTQTVSAGKHHELEQDLDLSHEVSSEGSEFSRTIEHNLGLVSSANGFNPNSNPRRWDKGCSPKASGNLMLSTFDGSKQVNLKNPETDNQRRVAFERVYRETLGGHLTVFRDPTWPTLQTLLFTLRAVKKSMLDDLRSFMLSTLGIEVRLSDWLGEQWEGIIVNPNEPAVEDKEGYWTFAFEFEGKKVDFNSFYNQLALVQDVEVEIIYGLSQDVSLTDSVDEEVIWGPSHDLGLTQTLDSELV